MIEPTNTTAGQSCLPCIDNAFCGGGDQISPLTGFWRASNQSSLIIECPVKDSCMGVINNNISDPYILIRGECLEGHWGALIYECTKGLARFRPKSLCKPYDVQPLIYIKMIISTLFLIMYIIFQAKIFSKMERKEPNIAICIKLLLNHLQSVGLIGLIDLGWTLDFKFYFSFQDYISFLTEDFLVIDCFVRNIDEDILVIKIIFSTLLPIKILVKQVILNFLLYLNISQTSHIMKIRKNTVIKKHTLYIKG